MRVRLTTTGEALVVETYELQNRDEARIFGDMEPDDLHALTSALRRLLSKMSA